MKNCHFRTILYYNFLWFTSGLLAADFMAAQKVWDLNEKPWTLCYPMSGPTVLPYTVIMAIVPSTDLKIVYFQISGSKLDCLVRCLTRLVIEFVNM